MLAGVIRRHVSHEIAVPFLSGKRGQQAANVDLVSREVAADGVGINGETH